MIIFTDIHGNFDTFIALLAKIPIEEREKGIVIAGDLVDRGPRSMEMVQYCIDNKISVVRGNHEDMMIEEGLEEAEHFNEHGSFNWMGSYSYDANMGNRNIWGINGGFIALSSYFDDDCKKVNIDLLKTHIKWMKELPYFLEFKDIKNEKDEHLLVTHSTACKVWSWSEKHRKENNKSFISNLIWGRPTVITPIKNIFNIFGHTPIPNGPKVKEGFANIDTGCFYDKPGFFKLTAVQFPEMVVYQQDNVDKNDRHY